MHDAIELRVERKRGCGYRGPGGVYLCDDGPLGSCGKLPLELKVCPTCSQGIKPARGWTWVEPIPLFLQEPCLQSARLDGPCAGCILGGRLPTLERAGLIWIGEQYYKTPEEFSREVVEVGFSRKLSCVPNDFEVGKTWVLVAHRKALQKVCDECGGIFYPVCETKACEKGQIYTPAIFGVYRPTRIEKVVSGDETDEEIESWVKRGIIPVKIQQSVLDQSGTVVSSSATKA